MAWAGVDGEINPAFYANKGKIAGQYHAWVQDLLTVMVAIICRKGPDANLDKTKAMFSTPGFIWGKWG